MTKNTKSNGLNRRVRLSPAPFKWVANLIRTIIELTFRLGLIAMLTVGYILSGKRNRKSMQKLFLVAGGFAKVSSLTPKKPVKAASVLTTSDFDKIASRVAAELKRSQPKPMANVFAQAKKSQPKQPKRQNKGRQHNGRQKPPRVPRPSKDAHYGQDGVWERDYAADWD